MIKIKNFLSRFKEEKKLLFLFFGFKLILVVFVLSFYDLIPFSQRDYNLNSDHFHGQAQSRLEMGLSAYDGPQYLDIAYFGYEIIGEVDSKKYAFFPFYPLLIKVFAPLFNGNYTLSALLISLLAHLFGFILFFKLLNLEKTDEKGSWLSLKYFLIYPTAIFFLATYTESLFFLLSVLTFFLLRKKKFYLSALTGFLGALTRPPGILLFIPFVLELFFFLKETGFKNFLKSSIREKAKIITPLFVPLGTLSYFFYLKLITGNFNSYFEALAYWKRSELSLKNVFTVLFDRITNFASLPLHSFYASKLDLIFVLFFLSLLLIFYKKIRFSYFAYGLSLIFLPLLSGQTMSLMRYLSVCFPVFIILGKITKKNKVLDFILTLIFILLLSVFSLKFFNWYWVG